MAINVYRSLSVLGPKEALEKSVKATCAIIGITVVETWAA